MTQNMVLNHNDGQPITYMPQLKALVGKWVHPQDKAGTNKNKGEVLDLNTTWVRIDSSQATNKHPYNPNYKGKSLMTRTQWLRYQRQKKVSREMQDSGNNQAPKAKTKMARKKNHGKIYPTPSPVKSKVEVDRRPLKQKLDSSSSMEPKI